MTAKFIGLSPELMSLDQWATSLIETRTNDGFNDDDTWMRYAKLALAYKNQYINLNNNTNSFSGHLPMLLILYSLDTDWQDIMWGQLLPPNMSWLSPWWPEVGKYRLSLGYMFDDSNLKWAQHNNCYNQV